jgi:hypothetical protein
MDASMEIARVVENIVTQIESSHVRDIPGAVHINGVRVACSWSYPESDDDLPLSEESPQHAANCWAQRPAPTPTGMSEDAYQAMLRQRAADDAVMFASQASESDDDLLLSDDDLPLSDDDLPLSQEGLPRDDPYGVYGARCSRCNYSRREILMRGGAVDPLECLTVYNMENGEELICRSCSYDEEPDNPDGPKWCVDCHLCDRLEDNQGNSYRGTFIPSNGEFLITMRCYDCHCVYLENTSVRIPGTEVCYDYNDPYIACLECGVDIYEKECEHILNNEITCSTCGSLGAWECLCDDSTMIDSIYNGEFENEPIPENNTEKAKEIKGDIKDIGEEIFAIQSSITEGSYLKIMNMLQKVTNCVNAL